MAWQTTAATFSLTISQPILIISETFKLNLWLLIGGEASKLEPHTIGDKVLLNHLTKCFLSDSVMLNI
jgi:hypothetical protein